MKKTTDRTVNKISKMVVNAAIPGLDFPPNICPLFFGKPKSSHKLTSADYKELSSFLKSK